MESCHVGWVWISSRSSCTDLVYFCLRPVGRCQSRKRCFNLNVLNNTTHWIRLKTFGEAKIQPLFVLRVPRVILGIVCELMQNKKCVYKHPNYRLLASSHWPRLIWAQYGLKGTYNAKIQTLVMVSTVMCLKPVRELSFLVPCVCFCLWNSSCDVIKGCPSSVKVRSALYLLDIFFTSLLNVWKVQKSAVFKHASDGVLQEAPNMWARLLFWDFEFSILAGVSHQKARHLGTTSKQGIYKKKTNNDVQSCFDN